MCDIYASTDPLLYQSVARSVRIGGVVTSIKVERRFWQILETIAAEGGLSLAQFLTQLHDEVIERRGEIGNFASLLRVVCVTHLGLRLNP
ncbi:ribbon-helix-helix domain-containing protein [Magnetospirillum sulfuroxidans]|jgi:predicted DNA-binding ribbon-helix-helix protein|uniref:Ribbon-helix-helix domain-containing protein n=1 Tax=Magnetospirillum sulfuroxidans TaxID=611300 RepID=A0ABS5IFT0_9PROT|nr:ribbon-helix-helix domain-containing protein [Magnetospirillum sulfuroxidans]MBR9973266.1 ribbon-helix-helix domain-containing protein [Magnetospirillum sulfuroxidans]